MKKNLFLIIAFLLCCISAAVAQNNDKISYQAVVRNSANQLVYNTDLTVTVSIANSDGGTAVYVERHAVTSNANGLISLLIGDGEYLSGNWKSILWNHAFVTTEIAQGNTILSTVTVPLSAVPYSFTANYADSVDVDVIADYLTSHGYITEEVQVLSISNDTVFLTGGSFVKLPAGFSGNYDDLTNKPDLDQYATNAHLNDTLGHYPTTQTLKDTAAAIRNDFPVVPENVSAFNNDAGYLTSDSAVITTLQGDVTTLQEATRKDALCDSVETCVKGWISDSTRMVYDSLHTYYVNTNTLRDTAAAIRGDIPDVSGFATKDELRADSTVLANRIVTDSTVLANRIVTDSAVLANRIVTDSLALVNRIVTDSTILHGAIKDTATAIRNSIGNGTLTIKQGDNTLGTFNANQKENANINVPVPAAPNNGQITITRNNQAISNGTFNVDQSISQTIDIPVPTKLSEMVNDGGSYAKRDSVNVFTAANDFTGGSITVPSNEDAIKRPVPSTTPAPECTNMNAVNVCDLLAVFDSLTKRIDALQQELEDLKRATPPTVRVSPRTVNSTTIKATAIANGHGAAVTSYEFCISAKKDMSEIIGCYPSETNEYVFTGLTPNTFYYVTAKATTMVGMGESEVDSARTLALAPTATVTIPDVDVPSGFQLEVSEISPKGKTDSVTVQVCYQQKQGGECPDKLDPSYADCTEPQLVTDTTVNVVQTVTGLLPLEDYCAIVKVSNGDSTTIYGPFTVTTGVIVTMKISSDPADGINRCGSSVKVTYTATIVGANTSDYTYSWKVGNSGQSETSNIFSYTYSANTYDQKVTCIATRDGNAPLYDTIKTSVYSMGKWPDIDFCEDDEQLTVTVVRKGNNPIKSLSWGDGNSIPYNSSGINLSVGDNHQYSSPETYTITVNGNDQSFPCLVTRVVKFNNPPRPCVLSGDGAISTQNNTAFSNEAGTGTRVDSVRDHEGNWYEVVQIGTQCWLKENMRATTSPSTGTYIVYKPASSNDNTIISSYTSKIAHWYKNDSLTYAPKDYGLLYNWCAAMDTFRTGSGYDVEKAIGNSITDDDRWLCTISGNRRGICPFGWHIPTNEEWTEMETKVNDGVPQFENPNHENGFRGSHAGKLSTGCDWTNNDRITGGAPKESCSPGDYSFADRNISGFSALPSGSFGENSSAQWVFMNAGPVANNASGNALFTDAVFWSTQYSPSPSATCCAWTRSLRCNSQGVFYTNYDKSHGYSVRCVRDAESGGEPTSATLQISLDEDSPSVCSGGSVTVTYTASVSDGASVDAYDYSWTVPTSVQHSANGNVCTVIYTEANTYTVSCTATPVGAGDAIGNEATVTVALGSGTLPAFTTCERDDNRHVKITSSENVQSFSWGDGTSSVDISHDYSEDGVYTITAVNDNCSTSKTVSVGKKTLHPCAVTAIHNYTGDGEETVDSEGRVTTVKDYDGNIYSVAQIGSQCWLAENMRCTHSPSTGNPIVIQDDNIGEWDNMAATSCVSKAAHWYYNKEGHRFGILYNWCAAVDTFKSGEAEVATFERYTGDWYDGPDQIAWNANIGRNDVRRGICPKGWHVPNLQEVLNLATVVNNGNLTYEYPIYTGGNAGTLAKGCDWDNGSEDDESPETASPGDYEFAGRNQYGFGALPVGSFEYYEYDEDDDETGYSLFSGSAYRAAFWITTDNDSSHTAYAGYPWSLRLPLYNSVDIDIAPDRTKDAGMSVRCVRD